jgi:hypothetical protein
MALPDYQEITQGTAIVWGEAGASGVTATLSLDALANGAARMGAAVDLGANFAPRYAVIVRAETGSAPTAGNTCDVYLLASYDNSNWPAKVTGSDGSYTLGTSDANLRQAGPPVSSLIATADGNTVLEQAAVIWEPAGRYVVPIFDNNLGQALRDETTATDNGSRVILIPLRGVIND